MSKKKPAKAPWEVTEQMFLSETETDELLAFLRNAEVQAVPEAQVRTATDRLIVELLVFTGLRNSELCQLRVVDTALGHGHCAVSVASTPRQNRMVAIPRCLNEAIERYVRLFRPSLLPSGSSVRDEKLPLILNERGKPYDRTALYRRVVRILTEAGLGERASVQLLRHTYGFLAYKRTRGNLLFVQRQMGHAHPMVTAVYAQFAPFSDAELADCVAQPLESKGPQQRTGAVTKPPKGRKR